MSRENPCCRLRASLLGLVSMGVCLPLWAHHSTSLYDAGRQVSMTGTVASMFWGNPHIYITLLVPAATGQAASWSIVSGTPALNVRNGWKYSDVKVGDKVTVLVNPAKNGTHEAILDRITLADGRSIEGPREFLKKPDGQQGP